MPNPPEYHFVKNRHIKVAEYTHFKGFLTGSNDLLTHSREFVYTQTASSLTDLKIGFHQIRLDRVY